MPVLTKPFSVFASGDTGVVWSDPANAAASDDARATALLDSGNILSQYLRATGADFSELPDGSVINSVTLRVEASKSGSDALGFSVVQAWDGAALQGDNQSDSSSLTTSDVNYDRGADDWSWWTAARLKDPLTGVAVRFQHFSGFSGATAQVDFLELTVDYTPPVSVRPPTQPVARSLTFSLASAP